MEEKAVVGHPQHNTGRNMLHLAAEMKAWVEAFNRVVEMGMDPMELDVMQRTALDVAAACENEEILGLFERVRRTR